MAAAAQLSISLLASALGDVNFSPSDLPHAVKTMQLSSRRTVSKRRRAEQDVLLGTVRKWRDDDDDLLIDWVGTAARLLKRPDDT